MISPWIPVWNPLVDPSVPTGRELVLIVGGVPPKSSRWLSLPLLVWLDYYYIQSVHPSVSPSRLAVYSVVVW